MAPPRQPAANLPIHNSAPSLGVMNPPFLRPHTLVGTQTFSLQSPHNAGIWSARSTAILHSSDVMAVDGSVYRSPKRKRERSSFGPSLTTSTLSRRHSSPPRDADDDVGSHSPSTRITGKLQKLDLKCQIRLSSPCVPCDSDDDKSSSSYGVVPTPLALSRCTAPKTSASAAVQEFKPPESANFNFESPVNSDTKTLSTSQSCPSIRMKSPPPSYMVSDQYWHASEITGWSPDDPDEDNYGINGVGYAKTASKAWAISQKRKQQIADYRSRETREARQKRHERRLSGFNSRRGSPRGSPGPPASERSVGNKPIPSEKKEVRFVLCGDD